MKKSFTLALLTGWLCLAASAQTSILSSLNTDFDALLTGIARDVAPTMGMNALAADVVGDATIEKFTIFLPSLGVNISNGIGTILKPGAHEWQFLIPMDSLINTMVGKDPETKKWLDMFEGGLMAYPSIKIGFGIGFGSGFDAIVSGMLIPQALTDTIIAGIGDATISGLKPQFEIYNLGIKVRKSLLEDKGAIPAFSVGLGYTLAGANIGLNSISLSALAGKPMDVGFGGLELSGKLGYAAQVHNIGLTLHLSKHLLFITPFLKLTGVYQYTSVKGDTELAATITPTIPAGTPAAVAALIKPISETLSSKPDVTISDFSTIATVGMEIYLAFFVLDANLAIDLARASFATASNPIGFTGNAISANFAIRFDF